MNRNKSSWWTWLAIAFVLVPVAAGAQGTRADYQRAEQFLSPNVDELVLNESVNPEWIGESDRFWYRRQLPDGKLFLVVDADRATREPAFDHERLASALSQATGTTFEADNLPFETFELGEEVRLGGDARGSIELTVDELAYRCDLQSYACEPAEGRRGERGGGRGGGGRGGAGFGGQPRLNRPSPDGKWVAFHRDHNLWVRSTESGEEIRLSDDGEAANDYMESLPSPRDMVAAQTEDVEMPVAATWSPDSRKIISYRLDRRSARTFTVVQAVPENQVRPISYTYHYALPGEVGITHAELVVFDVYKRTKVAVETPPIELLYYPLLLDDREGPRFTWFEDGERFYFRRQERGYQMSEIVEVDAATGKTRALVHERLEPHINSWSHHWRVLGDGAEVLWSSERDGWNHLYLYDGATGEVKRRLTSGKWVVRDLARVDEESRAVYFTAGGREAGRDPYLRHLYRVGMDGGEVTLLTPENAEHAVDFSFSGRFFVDTYSRADTMPVSVLRRSDDGEVVMELEKADIERLLATGWKWPEPFKGKARDGQTDIYGIIWRPSNLDPSQKYPVVELIYAGPHGSFVPKTFRAYLNMSQAIAELGFISVQIDGLGTNHRGKEFGDFSYKNLGDGGIPDHIALMRQMAEEYPYIDLDRVGIWGGSAGGYGSTHAILMHPDFYKVAVSTSGNHDHRMDKASWNEMWMGFPLDDHYIQQSNVTNAHRLEGKLFLAHGELDDNVPVSATLQVVDALIKANKDFDLLIMPGRFHGLGGPYFNRKRWDYFVEHLLGVEPPAGYEIGAGNGASR